MSLEILILLSLTSLPAGRQGSFKSFKANLKSYKELYSVFRKYSSSSVRATINSLFYDGAIEKVVRNDVVYFSLTQSGWNRLSKSMLAPLNAFTTQWDKKWRIVAFNIPEKQRQIRDTLRKSLTEAKFGRLSNSFYISPWPHLSRVEKIRPEDQNVFIFEAQISDSKKIANLAFGLNKLSDKYRDWIKKTNLLQYRADILIYYYDGILKTDPALPRELLPKDWPFIGSWRIFIGLLQKKGIMSK